MREHSDGIESRKQKANTIKDLQSTQGFDQVGNSSILQDILYHMQEQHTLLCVDCTDFHSIFVHTENPPFFHIE